MAFPRFQLLLLACCSVVIEHVSGTDRHMICKEIADVFSPVVSPGTYHANMSQGKPGKRGARGENGPPGPPGPQGVPGEVNYRRVSGIARTEVQKVRNDMGERLEKLENYVEAIRNGLCQVEYQGKCFWVIFSKINFFQAQTECAKSAANASNIYDQEHFEKIMAYVRKVMPAATTYIEPWLGMTIVPSTGEVSLRDGTPAPYLKWYTGYPTNHAVRTQIILQVRPNVATASQNMWNYDPKAIRDGVLCEFEK